MFKYYLNNLPNLGDALSDADESNLILIRPNGIIAKIPRNTLVAKYGSGVTSPSPTPSPSPSPTPTPTPSPTPAPTYITGATVNIFNGTTSGWTITPATNATSSFVTDNAEQVIEITYTAAYNAPVYSIPSTSISNIIAGDELVFEIKKVSGTVDSVTLRINGAWQNDGDSVIKLHNAMPVNTWTEVRLKMSSVFRNYLGNNITTFQLKNELGLGTIRVRGFKFVQDEGGSLSYNRSLNTIAGMPNFSTDSIFLRGIDDLAVHARSSVWIGNYSNKNFHADWGTLSTGYGIPINIDSSTATATQVTINNQWASQSDGTTFPWRAGVYTPENWLTTANVATDHHIIVVDSVTGIETDTYLYYDPAASQSLLTNNSTAILGLAAPHNTLIAGSIAKFDLKSTTTRQKDYTSSDAAGLPVAPFMLRFEDIVDGDLAHPLRFTVQNAAGAIWPATHATLSPWTSATIYNDSNSTTIPPLGAWMRLKANYDISGMSLYAQRVCRGMKKFGLINADNGSSFYIQGQSDDRWTTTIINELQSIPATAFEFVDVSPKMHKITSYRGLA